MSMMQIGAVGVLGALMAIQLKGGKTEYSLYMSVAVGIFLFFCIIQRLEVFVEMVSRVKNALSMDAGYLSTLLKMLGLTYIAEFSSGICRDAGYQNIAVQIETFCKLTILALGMPVMLALFETIQGFLA